MTSEIVISSKYNEASMKFRDAWEQYQQKEELVKIQVVSMVTILEKEGLSRTKAIQKIIEDHKDLSGFSRATIYRELPKEVKNDYTKPDRKLSNTKNVSRETFLKESKGLKELREAKGIKEQSVNTAELIEDGSQEPEITYDPNFVDNLIKTKAKYEELIIPFDAKVIATVKGQDIPFIVKVDPYKRVVTSLDVDEKEAKKIKK